jgi:hypothetical protein
MFSGNAGIAFYIFAVLALLKLLLKPFYKQWVKQFFKKKMKGQGYEKPDEEAATLSGTSGTNRGLLDVSCAH